MKLNMKNFRVSTQFWPKRTFDPKSSDDLAEYKYFLQKQAWREGCPFVLEWPFLNVISMIEHKITRHHLSVKQK